MRTTLTVERLGHFNHFASDYHAAMAAYRNIFAAEVFREWQEREFGGENSLFVVGSGAFELFAGSDPSTAIGGWVDRHQPGWHSIEWTIDSLDSAIETLSERGIRVTDRSASYVFTHPKDLHGLCLELTPHHFDGDPREAVGWQPTRWLDEHPLGLSGKATMRVAAGDSAASALDVAALTGRDVELRTHPDQGVIGHSVAFADHEVEFVSVLNGEVAAPLAYHIAAHGERIFCVSMPVIHIERARDYLESLRVGVTRFGDSLLIDPSKTQGALFELSPQRS